MCCCAIASIPPPDKVTPDTPLRLEIAAALAFPDGSMTASGLRREGARGRLTVERIAGRDYTTLANIERMRKLCRVEAKAHTCGSGRSSGTVAEKSYVAQPGSSSTAVAKSPQDALRAKLQRRRTSSPHTSVPSTSPPGESAISKR